ncbi:phasin family protein [Granulibacter bethesdensis]|uniref:Inclusion body associated protein n=2 Tax=Granulibacter bethesdensis TaxID=364410 RepID=A0A286M351_GRABC|nr:phasin family protein [Granulibacter bethesdensis]AHJ63546.1 Inclusion body associated protein [Granulibacter bethesdensis]AHJ65876.1 Inclusion body associated protein [Granulibacter bethesdensis CGDNIH4]AHJ68513.1 Inclusion body associated protein [Granulibacter bethesdensis]APH52395.1 Inclusion body associated protein [Granulibacter bethesdensis]APH65085.1 Inclusion body associated protein [Granulibacter bethesdensis]
MIPGPDDLMAFHRDNFDALLQCSQVWASGFQELSRQWLASAQDGLETATNAMRRMAETRSVQDMIEVQNSFARDVMEKAVVDTSRLADASMRVAEQALAPLTERVSAAVDRMG